MTHCAYRSRVRVGHQTATGPATPTRSHERWGRVEATRTALGEALVMHRRTRVRFPPPPPRGLRRLCGDPSQNDEPPRTGTSGAVLLSSGISRPDASGSRSPRDARGFRTPQSRGRLRRRGGLGVRVSYQEPPPPQPPPPSTSPGEDRRRVPVWGARALPAQPADLVVRTRGPLAVRVSLDVGVKPKVAPQGLPSHRPNLGVTDPAGKGATARRARRAPPVPRC